jgi:internalin A
LKEAGTNNCQQADVKLNKWTDMILTNKKISDLRPLAGFTNLTQLWLDRNQITDLRPLANLSKMNILHLDRNQIIDLSPLADLHEMVQLHLANNKIVDVTPLATIGNLGGARLQIIGYWIDLENNQIIDASPLAGLINRTGFNLKNNPIVKKDCPPKPEITELCGFYRAEPCPILKDFNCRF